MRRLQFCVVAVVAALSTALPMLANARRLHRHRRGPSRQPRSRLARSSAGSWPTSPATKIRIAYMPPATEFNYYMAIGEGVEAWLQNWA